MNIHTAIENSALESCVISQDHCGFIIKSQIEYVALFQLIASNYLKKFDSVQGRKVAERFETIFNSENWWQATDKYELEFYAAEFLQISNRSELNEEVLKWGAFRDAKNLELKNATIWAFNITSTGLLNVDELDLCFWNGTQEINVILHERPFLDEDKLTLKIGNPHKSQSVFGYNQRPIEIRPISENLCSISEAENLTSVAHLNDKIRYQSMRFDSNCLLSAVTQTIDNTEDILSTNPLAAFNHVCQLIDMAFDFPQEIQKIADRITNFSTKFPDLMDSWSFKTSVNFHKTHPGYKLNEVLPVIKELGACLAKYPANERIIWEFGYSIMCDLIDVDCEESVLCSNVLTNEEKLANFKLVVESDLHPYFGLEASYGERYALIKEQVDCESLANSFDEAVSDLVIDQQLLSSSKSINESQQINSISINSL